MSRYHEKYRIEVSGTMLDTLQAAIEAYENFYQGRHRQSSGLINTLNEVKKARDRYNYESGANYRRWAKERKRHDAEEQARYREQFPGEGV